MLSGVGDFPKAMVPVEAFPFGRVGWPLAASAKQKRVFIAPVSPKKQQFDLVNL